MKEVIIRNWHSNPVLTAIYEKDLLAFRALIAVEGFDINELITGGWTCLQVACYLNRIDFVQELFDNEETAFFATSPESRFQTSLHIACNRGHSEIARILLGKCTNSSSTQDLRDTAFSRLALK